MSSLHMGCALHEAAQTSAVNDAAACMDLYSCAAQQRAETRSTHFYFNWFVQGLNDTVQGRAELAAGLVRTCGSHMDRDMRRSMVDKLLLHALSVAPLLCALQTLNGPHYAPLVMLNTAHNIAPR